MIQQVIDPAAYSFSPFFIPPLLVGVLTAVLGLFILVREKASLVSLAFHGICTLAAAWLLSLSMVLLATSPRSAFLWLRIETAAASLIPHFVFLFTLATLRLTKRFRGLLVISLVSSIAFSVLALATHFFLRELALYSWGYYAHYGTAGILFLAYFFSIMLFSLRLFWRESRRAGGLKRKRINIFLWSFGIGYFASIDFLPALGVPVFPFGYLFAAVYLALMSFGIWRYRSLDLDSSFAADEILKAVSDAIVVVDVGGIVRLSNYAANRLFNNYVSLEGEPMRPRGIPFFKPENLSRLLYGSRTESLEVNYQDPDRETVFLSISSSPLYDKTGAPLALLCSIRDITKHKEAEAALRESEHRYRLLAENISDVLWTMNKDLRCTFVSPSIARLCGFTPEEAMQRTVEKIFTPASLKLFMSTAAEAITQAGGDDPDSGPAVLELELVCRNGATVWAEVKISFIRGGAAGPELLCVARNITERKRARTALEESENCYQEMIRTSLDPIISLDRHGYVINVNHAAEIRFGYPGEELKDKHFSKTGIFSESSLAKTLQEFTFSILGWQRKPFEVQMMRKGRETVSLRASIRLIRRDPSNPAIQLVLRENLNLQEDIQRRLSA